MDSSSCNYNSDAEEDDGTCLTNDCSGECGGLAVVDSCLVCDIDISNDCTQDCAGNWGGTAIIDSCNVCGGTILVADDCPQCADGLELGCDLVCAVNPKVLDECGVCGGNGIPSWECDCDGNALDCSDVCGGTDLSCQTGCTNPNACNFDANATILDDSCWFITTFCVCSDGKGAVADNCGTCDTDSSNDCVQDCAGTWGGTAVDTDGNGICDSDEPVYGCTTPSACNFDSTATIFDDSCWSATEGCACSDGEGAIKDNCDTCDTDTSNDCGWQVQFEASEDLFGLYFVDANTGFAVGRDGLILRTINGGSNWTSIDGGTSKLLWGIYFVDVNTGWGVGADGTIINTVDGGESWSDQTISGLSNHLRDVFFIDTNTGWVVGNNDKIYKTIDGGSNWTSQATGTDYSFQGVYCIDSNICMITGIDPMASDESIIFRTTDGGINWVLNYVGDGWLRGIYFHENTGWVVGDSGGSSDGASPIINSNDGGLTWSKQSSGIFDTNLNDVYFVDENKGWAVGTKVGGGSVIINTVDGGTSWSTQQSNTNFELRAVHFINDKGWAVGQGGGFILRYIE